MNMKYEAMRLLIESDDNIIITGNTGSGKTTLILECNIPDSRYFDFKYNCPNYWLTEEAFNQTDFEKNIFDAPEKTIILDAVEFPDDLTGSKIVHLIRTIRKSGKRLIVVAYPDNARQVLALFGTVIHLEKWREHTTYSIAPFDIMDVTGDDFHASPLQRQEIEK